MAALTGLADPKTRRGGRLSIDHPMTTKTLAALSLVDVNMADLRSFSNALHRDTDSFLRGRGFSHRGRITKRDAEHLLKKGLFGSAVRS